MEWPGYLTNPMESAFLRLTLMEAFIARLS